jgi:signal transduction histidine kinase
MDIAIKYLPEGGTITIKTSVKEEGHFEIILSNNGIGILPKARARIFERFFRVDRGRSREPGGIGLGLSIVKQIVELHKGTIQL